MTFLIELGGWLGMALIVGAFYLVSHGKVHPKDRRYQYMNIAGSVGIGIDVYFARSWPALALEIIWILVALSALARSARAARAKRTDGK